MHWCLICNSEAKYKEAVQKWSVLTPVCGAWVCSQVSAKKISSFTKWSATKQKSCFAIYTSCKYQKMSKFCRLTHLTVQHAKDTKLSNLIVFSYMQQNLKAIIIMHCFDYSIRKHQYSSQTSLLQIFLPEYSSLHLQSLSRQPKYPLVSKEIN